MSTATGGAPEATDPPKGAHPEGTEYRCDGCENDRRGPRVVFTTEATDGRGVDVVVAKRWTVCPSCADDVFSRIGEPSPWSDEDFKTMILPDDELASQHQGGYVGRIG